MKIALKMPRVSMNMEEGTLVRWCKQPGERFTTGEILYELETEKATSDFEAPCDGVMLSHIVSEGEDIPVGDVVCRIEKTD